MTEETIINKLTELLNSINDESGIMVQDINVSWINLDTAEQRSRRVSDINIQLSKDLRSDII